MAGVDVDDHSAIVGPPSCGHQQKMTLDACIWASCLPTTSCLSTQGAREEKTGHHERVFPPWTSLLFPSLSLASSSSISSSSSPHSPLILTSLVLYFLLGSVLWKGKLNCLSGINGNSCQSKLQDSYLPCDSWVYGWVFCVQGEIPTVWDVNCNEVR